MDQNIATYRIYIRSRKWWLPLFAYLLHVAMQNECIIYRQTEGAWHRPLDQLEFRRDICSIDYTCYSLEHPLIGRPFGRPKHLDSRAPEEIRTDRTDHFIESIQTQRRCAVCGVKVKKQCSKCNVGCLLRHISSAVNCKLGSMTACPPLVTMLVLFQIFTSWMLTTFRAISISVFSISIVHIITSYYYCSK